MTEAVQLAIIACVPPTIVALAGLLVSISNRKKVTETKQLVVEVDSKATDIKKIANGANTELKNELKVYAAKLAGLEMLFAQMQEEKRITAQAQAALLTAAIAAPAPEVTAALVANTAQLAALAEIQEHDRRNRKAAALGLAAARAETLFAETEAQREVEAKDRGTQ